MNWLDRYIFENDNGFLINESGGLFVALDGEYVRHAKGDADPVNLMEIHKDEFIRRLVAK